MEREPNSGWAAGGARKGSVGMGEREFPMQLLVTAAALAQTVGNAVVAAYQRSSMLELRRPVLQKWVDFICPTDNVVPIKRGAARSRSLSPLEALDAIASTLPPGSVV